MSNPLQFNHDTTQRGFPVMKFDDLYNTPCSLQLSSLAEERAVWLGLNEAEPKILASKIIDGGTGWVKYPLHEEVFIPTRMHLSQDQVRALIPVLQHFVDYGDLPDQEQEKTLPAIPDLGTLVGVLIHYCDTQLCDTGLCPAADLCDGSGPCADKLEEWARSHS